MALFSGILFWGIFGFAAFAAWLDENRDYARDMDEAYEAYEACEASIRGRDAN